MGDPLDTEWEGEARASLVGPPPPLLLVPTAPPPCDAADKPAAEEASDALAEDGMARDRAEDSSVLVWCCCDPGWGEKEDVEDEMDELRLGRFCRAVGAGKAEGFEAGW